MRASVYDIKLPRVKWDGFDNPMKVGILSPFLHRRAVYTLATFFRREFKYDFVQYGKDGRESDPNHVAYLWINSVWDELCIGATCFRWREWTDHEPGWAMQWIWFHPYERNKGHLTKIWPKFLESHGDFLVEPPLSKAMKCFLYKMGYGPPADHQNRTTEKDNPLKS